MLPDFRCCFNTFSIPHSLTWWILCIRPNSTSSKLHHHPQRVTSSNVPGSVTATPISRVVPVKLHIQLCQDIHSTFAFSFLQNLFIDVFFLFYIREQLSRKDGFIIYVLVSISSLLSFSVSLFTLKVLSWLFRFIFLRYYTFLLSIRMSTALLHFQLSTVTLAPPPGQFAATNFTFKQL